MITTATKLIDMRVMYVIAFELLIPVSGGSNIVGNRKMSRQRNGSADWKRGDDRFLVVGQSIICASHKYCAKALNHK